VFFVSDVLCAYVVGVGVEYGDCYEPEYAYPVLCCHGCLFISLISVRSPYALAACPARRFAYVLLS